MKEKIRMYLIHGKNNKLKVKIIEIETYNITKREIKKYGK